LHKVSVASLAKTSSTFRDIKQTFELRYKISHIPSFEKNSSFTKIKAFRNTADIASNNHQSMLLSLLNNKPLRFFSASKNENIRFLVMLESFVLIYPNCKISNII